MEGTLLSCQVTGIRSLKDGSVSITLETQELSGGKAGEIFSLRNKVVAAYISPKETIKQSDLDQVDEVDVDLPGKSQSQRIRSVLFILYEQNKEGYKDFKGYYAAKTELLIDHLKTKIKD